MRGARIIPPGATDPGPYTGGLPAIVCSRCLTRRVWTDYRRTATTGRRPVCAWCDNALDAAGRDVRNRPGPLGPSK